MNETQEEHEEGSEEEVEQIDLAEVPVEDGDMFRGLRALALQSMTNYIAEAARYQHEIEGAKTDPKRRLYQKKFTKVKAKFQDEIARLQNIEHIMRENNIPFEVEPEEEEEQNG